MGTTSHSGLPKRINDSLLRAQKLANAKNRVWRASNVRREKDDALILKNSSRSSYRGPVQPPSPDEVISTRSESSKKHMLREDIKMVLDSYDRTPEDIDALPEEQLLELSKSVLKKDKRFFGRNNFLPYTERTSKLGIKNENKLITGDTTMETSANKSLKNIPFVTDELGSVEYYTGLFNTKDSCLKQDCNWYNVIIPDLGTFIRDIASLLSESSGEEVELFRRKEGEGDELIPYYNLYFRSKGDTNSLFIRMTLRRMGIAAFYTEEDIAKASTAYCVNYDFVGDLKVFTELENYRLTLDEYYAPRKEGVYNIHIREFYSSMGVQENAHRMSTEDFDEVLLSMYPGIDMRDFLDSYIASDESISIFIGEPGTGKTSLLKLILREAAFAKNKDVQAVYVKDRAVLRQAGFWTNLSSMHNIEFLILDDLDHELLPRESLEFKKYLAEKDGKTGVETASEALDLEAKQVGLNSEKEKQTIVNQLLSFSNGLFQNTMKVLITTNLEDTSIDPALIRPGRCFDILKFPKLTIEHALAVWKNEFDLTEENFQQCFSEVLDKEGPAISQSLLASEAAEIRRNRLKGGYLKDKGISVRNKYM